jgi:hypothetical protein
MNELVKERIAIAEKFKSIHKLKFKSPERRKAMLKQTAFLEYPISSVILLVVIYASASTVFLSASWDNAALLVNVSLAMALRSPYAYLEVKLKEHIESIKNFEGDFKPELNVELESIISKLNNRTNLYVIWTIAGIICLSAFLQVFDANPYWNYFPVIVLVFSAFLLVRINCISFKFKKNLKSINI